MAAVPHLDNVSTSAQSMCSIDADPPNFLQRRSMLVYPLYFLVFPTHGTPAHRGHVLCLRFFGLQDTKKASATAVEVRDHLYQFVEKHAKMMESYRYLRQRVAELEGGPTLRIQSVSEVEADGLRKRIAELEAEAQDNQALQQRVEELEAQVRETDQLRKRVEELQELSRKGVVRQA